MNSENPFSQMLEGFFWLYLKMKKGTIIAFVISLIYCGLGVLVAFDLFSHIKIEDYISIYPEWLIGLVSPGFFLPFILSIPLKIIGLFLGGIITFLILFYILKTLLNWLFFEFQKRKN